MARPIYLDMTPAGRAALAALQKRTGLSRSDVLTHLINKHADDLAFADVEDEYPGKLQRNVMAIRLTRAARRRVVRARKRLGRSYSWIGEALVRVYGLKTEFPERPAAPKARRRLRP